MTQEVKGFTLEELDRLAEFAGLMVWADEYSVSVHYTLDDIFFCRFADWHPESNPAQADLVLRALAKRMKKPARLEIVPLEQIAGKFLCRVWQDCDFQEGLGDWWPEAVCRAALEIIKKES